jgi:hypothetical protein
MGSHQYYVTKDFNNKTGNTSNYVVQAVYTDELIWATTDYKLAQAIENALNSHDSLVARVEKLEGLIVELLTYTTTRRVSAGYVPSKQRVDDVVLIVPIEVFKKLDAEFGQRVVSTLTSQPGDSPMNTVLIGDALTELNI